MRSSLKIYSKRNSSWTGSVLGGKPEKLCFFGRGILGPTHAGQMAIREDNVPAPPGPHGQRKKLEPRANHPGVVVGRQKRLHKQKGLGRFHERCEVRRVANAT